MAGSDNYNKSAQRQFLVKVRGIEGHFMTKTGGEITAPTTKVWDGGRKKPDILSGPAEAGNITVSRVFRTHRDNAALRQLRRGVGYWRTTISIQPLNANLDRVGKPTVYPDALLVGLTEPDVDASSGDAAILSLEFAVTDWN